MLIGKLKYNSEKYSINPKEIRKRIQRKTTDRTNRKQKTKCRTKCNKINNYIKYKRTKQSK